MNAEVAMVFPALGLFSLSVGLTLFSLWVARMLAPWFLQERFDPPTMRSYFLDPAADMHPNRARIVTVLIAMAIMLAMLLVLAIAVRLAGVPLI